MRTNFIIGKWTLFNNLQINNLYRIRFPSCRVRYENSLIASFNHSVVGSVSIVFDWRANDASTKKWVIGFFAPSQDNPFPAERISADENASTLSKRFRVDVAKHFRPKLAFRWKQNRRKEIVEKNRRRAPVSEWKEVRSSITVGRKEGRKRIDQD